MSKIYLEVTAYPGTSVIEVAEQMAQMARKLDVSVWACVNGVKVVARPGDRGDDLVARWQAERPEPQPSSLSPP